MLNLPRFCAAFLLPVIIKRERCFLETRVAVIGIIVEDKSSVAALNDTLSQFGDYIIGRMGVPYHKKNISVISIAVDAPQNVINDLGGKIGRLSGVYAKTAYGNV